MGTNVRGPARAAEIDTTPSGEKGRNMTETETTPDRDVLLRKMAGYSYYILVREDEDEVEIGRRDRDNRGWVAPLGIFMPGMAEDDDDGGRDFILDSESGVNILMACLVPKTLKLLLAIIHGEPSLDEIKAHADDILEILRDRGPIGNGNTCFFGGTP